MAELPRTNTDVDGTGRDDASMDRTAAWSNDASSGYTLAVNVHTEPDRKLTVNVHTEPDCAARCSK